MSNESFKAGQKIACTILAPSRGGFSVSVIVNGKERRGYLPSQERLAINESVLVTFVSWSKGLALLTGPITRESVTTSGRSRGPIGRCVESLRLRYRRASDIMPIPVLGEVPQSFQLHCVTSVFCEEVSKNRHTGVIKVSSLEHKARVALLFHHGRIVGCIRNSIHSKVPLETRHTALDVLAIFGDSKAQIEMYDVPANIVIPMAALFCGYQYLLPDGLNPVGAILSVSRDLPEKNAVCIAISTAETLAFALFYKGQFSGFYCVEQQTFNETFGDLFELISAPSASILDCYILPNEFNSNDKDGFAFTYNERAL